jgi:hypothetical protein
MFCLRSLPIGKTAKTVVSAKSGGALALCHLTELPKQPFRGVVRWRTRERC